MLERVQASGRHLLGLINDVLDLSKIEAGQLALSVTDYSMPEIVERVVTATGPLAAEKGLALKVQLARRAAGRPGRRPADHAGAAQPGRQRDQVHRGRRGRRERHGGERRVRGRGRGHRTWDRS